MVEEAHFWAGSLVLSGSPPTLPYVDLGAGKPVMLLPWVLAVEEAQLLKGSWGLGDHRQHVLHLSPLVLCSAEEARPVPQNAQPVA